MNRDDIQREFDRFFEFETDDRRIVTSVSCRLFAEHIMMIERQECADACKRISEGYDSFESLNEFNQTFNEGRADGAEKCAQAINDRWKI